MKSLHQRKKTKKPSLVLIISIAASVLVVSLATWFLIAHKQDSSAATTGGNEGVNKISYDPPTKEEKQANSDQKDAIIQQQGKDTTPTDASLTITLSRSFQDASGFNLRTVVGGTTSGDCIATFTKSGQPTVIKTFAVGFEATSASCQNALTPISDFPSGGTWDLSLVVKKDNKQSTPTTTSVEITK